jgi:hypothetical protein
MPDKQGTRSFSSFRLGAIGAALLVFAPGSADAQTIRFRLISRDIVVSRLGEYGGKNPERGATLKRMFADAGCGEHLSEQPLKGARPPNVICVLPGTSNRIIIVGAHFDRTSSGDGVADNWSGASLLPSLYESLKVEPRRHTYIFIGFTDEEEGLIGSRFYARRMTAEQVAATDAMINLDTLGLAPPNVWTSRSDKSLTEALFRVSLYLKVPLSSVNFERVGSTDSESFRARKIPRITIHSLTQKNHDAGILHTKKDKLSAVNLDDHYATYHLVTVYLAYLDRLIEKPEMSAGDAVSR